MAELLVGDEAAAEALPAESRMHLPPLHLPEGYSSLQAVGSLPALGEGAARAVAEQSTEQILNLKQGSVNSQSLGPQALLHGQGSYASIGSVLLEDKRMLHELSESMVEQLNKMYGFFQTVMATERSRHSSEISLLMRKVDKDLRETFRSVRDTFRTLTEQVLTLARELELSRKKVKELGEKYQAAKKLAKTREHYCAELETMVEGSSSMELKTVAEANARHKEEMSLVDQRYREKRRDFDKEVFALKKENLRLEQELQVARRQPPPAMPGAAASWSRSVTLSDADRLLFGGSLDVVGGNSLWEDSVVQPNQGQGGSAHAPQGRGWSVAPPVGGSRIIGNGAPRRRPAPPNAGAQPHQSARRLRGVRDGDRTPREETSQRGPVGGEMAVKANMELRRKLAETRRRVGRQHRLLEFSTQSIVLLKNIFQELRHGGTLGGADQLGAEDEELARPAETLEAVARVFLEAIPRLGNLSQLFAAMTEELSEPVEEDDDLLKEQPQ